MFEQLVYAFAHYALYNSHDNNKENRIKPESMM